jgi:hypothetical protein
MLRGRSAHVEAVEDVEELTDDLHDLSTQSYEMGDALSRPIGEAFICQLQ